jgi:hypothetical protein
MRIAIISTVALSFGLACTLTAVAQPRNASPEHWQAIDRSMSDLLLEGYRPVSVIAPNSQLRIYYLSSGSFLAKCTEEARLAKLPPPPTQQLPFVQQPPSAMPTPSATPTTPGQLSLPGQGAAAPFIPEIEVTFECTRLSKSQ